MLTTAKANLLISLDFEMYWGLRASPGVVGKVPRLQRVPELVNDILDLFESYEVRATWATVGLLGLSSLDEARELIPAHRPEYTDERLDPYKDILGDGIESIPQQVMFAPDLVRKIAQSPGQELASHSYSHIYCMADGLSPEAFSEDIELANKVFSRFQAEPTSFIFPRNQVVFWALKLLGEKNYKSYRAGGKRWVSKGVSRKTNLLKLARVIDAIVPWSRSDLHKINPDSVINGLLELPASRFLRVNGAGGNTYQKLCINSVKREIDAAVNCGATYHLWCHPHNFSVEGKKSLERLEILLQHYQKHAKKGCMDSVNMSDLCERYVT